MMIDELTVFCNDPNCPECGIARQEAEEQAHDEAIAEAAYEAGYEAGHDAGLAQGRAEMRERAAALCDRESEGLQRAGDGASSDEEAATLYGGHLTAGTLAGMIRALPDTSEESER